MRGGVWIAAGLVAVGLAVLALLVVAPTKESRDAEDDEATTVNAAPANANAGSTAPRVGPPKVRVRPPSPGLKLGDGSKPGARSKAQAIADDAREQLERLDEADLATARAIYMRGHAALERVEDELPDDDEPGRAKLRADSDALRAQIERLFKP